MLFSKRIAFPFVHGVSRIKSSPIHITIISLITVLALVMLGKVIFRRGTPMRGGMPSGHSAVVFCLWTIIVFSTSNPLIIALSFLMAAALARTRMSEGIHTLWEVVAGGLLGFLTTLLVFQILK
jgi:diacylglycerol kinase (ATP)